MAVLEHSNKKKKMRENDPNETHDGPLKQKKKHKLKVKKLSQGEVDFPLKKKKKSKKRKASLGDNINMESMNEEYTPLRGMKKWLADYHSKRPGLEVLQQQIDAFIVDHEAQEEQARKEREATAAAEGWTVVVHQKGRKKTTDAEGGIAMGAVTQAAAQERNSKKKSKEAAIDFYRFQRRDARRNEILELQNKFEEDKKRIAQLRAARKFRPY
eukprot:Gb_30657 [translate_table: standard]